MKIVFVFIAVCFIALSCAVPVEDELEREKRSSSRESYRGGQFLPLPPSSNPSTNNNDWMNIFLPLLLARFFPAPAPAPAPAAGK